METVKDQTALASTYSSRLNTALLNGQKPVMETKDES